MRILEHIISDNKEKMAQAETKLAKNAEEITKLMKEYEGTIAGEEDRQCFAALTAARAGYLPIRKQVLDLSAAGKKQEAEDLMEARFNGLFNTYKEAAHNLLMLNMKQGEGPGSRSARLSLRARQG